MTHRTTHIYPHRPPPLATRQKKNVFIQVIDACFSAFSLQYHRTLCLSCNLFIICHRCYVLCFITYFVNLFKIERETRAVLFRSALWDCF